MLVLRPAGSPVPIDAGARSLCNAAPASLARRRRRAQAADAKTNWGSKALRGAGALGPWGTDDCMLRIDVFRSLSRGTASDSQNLFSSCRAAWHRRKPWAHPLLPRAEEGVSGTTEVGQLRLRALAIDA